MGVVSAVFLIAAPLLAAAVSPMILCRVPKGKRDILLTTALCTASLFCALAGTSGSGILFITAYILIMLGSMVGGIYIWCRREIRKLAITHPEATRIFYPPVPEIFISEEDFKKMREKLASDPDGRKAAWELLSLAKEYRIGEKRLAIAREFLELPVEEGNEGSRNRSGEKKGSAVPAGERS